jgi:hypothetical protein
MNRAELFQECKQLHPTYTEKQITEWVNHTMKTHPTSVRSKAKRCFRSSTWLWLWRLAVLGCLIDLVFRGYR